MGCKFKNILLTSILAVAGIFGVSSAIINKQVSEEPVVVDKAEAATDTTYNTSQILIHIIDLDGWTSTGHDLWIHCWDIKVSSSSIFTDINNAYDTSGAMWSKLRDHFDKKQDASQSAINFAGSYEWYGDESKRSYKFDFPWWITDFNYTVMVDNNYSTTNITDTRSGGYERRWFKGNSNKVIEGYVSAPASYNAPAYTMSFETNGGSEQSNFVLREWEKTSAPNPAPTKSGYYLNKWTTTDAADASAFTFGSNLTSPVKLYAQWTYTNPTVYFVNGGRWGTPHIYYWGGDTTVDYPGPAMSSTEAKIYCLVNSSWLNITIYKYTISGSPEMLQFNQGNDSAKTGDLRVSNGGIYYFDVADSFEPVASYLITLMNSMGSYTYNGQEYSKSICNLGGSSASLVSSYNSLANSGTANIATSIAGSTINTYATPVTSPSGLKTDITIPVLIAQINKNTSQGVYGAVRNFTPFNLFGEEDNLSTVIIIVASSVALLSVTALSILVIKKRKNKEE